MLKSRGSVHWPRVPQCGQAISSRPRGGPTLPVLELLLQVVGPESLVTGQALGQRIAEHPDVAGGHPHRAGQDDRGVEADDVVAPGDHRPPPLLLDVLLQLDAERAVVPGRPGPAVDLTGGEDEPAPLAQADHLFETVGVGSAGRGHVDSPQSTSDRPRLGRSQRTRLSPARAAASTLRSAHGPQTAWAPQMIFASASHPYSRGETRC